MAKKIDIAALASKLTQLNEKKGGNTQGGLTYANVQDGRNVFRILPPHDKMDTFGQEVWVHYGVGKKGNDKGQMVVCPTTHDENAKCPVCELSREIWGLSNKGKDKKIADQAKGLMRKKRVYFNVIDRADDLTKFELRDAEVNGSTTQIWYNTESDEQESPIKVLGTGIGIYKDLIGLIVDPEYGDITDPEEGLDVIITKSGSGQFNTEYDVKTVRKESEIGFEAWETNLNDLTVLATVKSYDDIANIMDGGSGNSSNSNSSSNSKEEEETKEENEPANNSDGDDDMGDEIQAALRKRREGK